MQKKISIITATKNRYNILLESTLKNIQVARQFNCEYIVVNDGDVFSFDAELSDIVLLDNQKQGVSKARNLGAKYATGEIFFFIDDDMWINKEIIDWINSFLSIEKNQHAVYNINWEYPPSLTDKLHHLKVGNYILSSGYNTMWGRMHQHGIQPEKGLYKFFAIASCSLVMHKKIFETIGGYNSSLIFQGEDIDLSSRINQLNIPVYAVFDTTLYHNHQDRIAINPYLERIYNGYESEFKAVKAGIVPMQGNGEYKGETLFISEIFRRTEKAWIFLLKILPGGKLFTGFNNKLIGALSGLQRYKQWRNILK